MRKKTVVLNVLLSSFMLMLLTGCDPTFEPLQENDAAPFSIHGYLDASADTQWIRVAPLRDKLDTPMAVPDMHVTLEHLESRTTVVMQDSLFNINEGNTAINVWTTMDIEPEQSYRLRAERPDGAASQVTVTIPPDFATPVMWTIGRYHILGYLFLKDMERVADVMTVWKVGQEIYFVPNRYRVDPNTAPAEFDYSAVISASEELQIIFPDSTPSPSSILSRDDVRRQLFVVSGGPEWREEISSLSDFDYSAPENLSNVENGVGYVVGVVSKTIPFKGCADFEENFVSCPLEEPMWK